MSEYGADPAAAVAGLQRARLTLQVMTSAVCSRWHTDYVTVASPAVSSTLTLHELGCSSLRHQRAPLQVRGLVTYCGPGTLFLDDQDVDRPGSGFMLFFGEDKQGHAVRRHGAVLQADAGDILLLKGRDYPGNEGGRTA